MGGESVGERLDERQAIRFADDTRLCGCLYPLSSLRDRFDIVIHKSLSVDHHRTCHGIVVLLLKLLVSNFSGRLEPLDIHHILERGGSEPFGQHGAGRLHIAFDAVFQVFCIDIATMYAHRRSVPCDDSVMGVIIVGEVQVLHRSRLVDANESLGLNRV